MMKGTMFTCLLEVQPRELEFTFELKKQSSCSISLYNHSQHYVAFKVKTTSPKKYCVRPNVGIIMPQSSLSCTVTMQAQRFAPPTLICKDKFLIMSTVVHAGTSEADIIAAMFSKDEGRYVEETKLKVILLSPSSSPSLSPIRRTARKVSHSEPTIIKDQVHNKSEVSPDFPTPEVVWKSGEVDFEEFSHVRDADGQKLIDDVEMLKSKLDAVESEIVTTTKEGLKSREVEFEELKPVRVDPIEAWKSGTVEFEVLKSPRDGEGQNLTNDIEILESKLDAVEPERHISNRETQNLVSELEMLKSRLNTVESKLVMLQSVCKPEEVKPEKSMSLEDVHILNSKLNTLDVKLVEAQSAIIKLSCERKQDMEKTQLLKQEIAILRRERVVKKVQVGFPFLFVCMVALINLVLGYLLHG